jgi:hypothetical protein
VEVSVPQRVGTLNKYYTKSYVWVSDRGYVGEREQLLEGKLLGIESTLEKLSLNVNMPTLLQATNL